MIAEAKQAILNAHWDINFTEFCQRAGFAEDNYAEGKWDEWQKLAQALNAFDDATLARLAGEA